MCDKFSPNSFALLMMPRVSIKMDVNKVINPTKKAISQGLAFEPLLLNFTIINMSETTVKIPLKRIKIK
jgi:hypothetical protein